MKKTPQHRQVLAPSFRSSQYANLSNIPSKSKRIRSSQQKPKWLTFAYIVCITSTDTQLKSLISNAIPARRGPTPPRGGAHQSWMQAHMLEDWCYHDHLVLNIYMYIYIWCTCRSDKNRLRILSSGQSRMPLHDFSLSVVMACIRWNLLVPFVCSRSFVWYLVGLGRPELR